VSGLYLAVKTAHVISGAILFGTGVGIAFFMFMAWRARDPAAFAATARHVVLADWLFTATAVAVQPLTGAALIALAGWSWTAPWLVAAYALYVLAGVCWLPVVWIQARVARRAAAAAADGRPVDAETDRLMRVWVALGVPAFAALIAVYWLMTAKPSF
jgi:uncharacterized membrane protein